MLGSNNQCEETNFFLQFFREEREEKKDTKTCEEEVQRLSDGSEIRTRKTRTFNMQQNSKQVFESFTAYTPFFILVNLINLNSNRLLIIVVSLLIYGFSLIMIHYNEVMEKFR